MAAHEIWTQARNRAQAVLGDSSEAAELLETAVEHVSRYLDRKGAVAFSTKVAGLLTLVFRRQLQKRAFRNGRVEAVGGTDDLDERLQAEDWSDDVNRRLDLEKIVRHLSARSCSILLLRQAGHDWKVIASAFGIAASTAQNRFWREVRDAQLKVLQARKQRECQLGQDGLADEGVTDAGQR